MSTVQEEPARGEILLGTYSTITKQGPMLTLLQYITQKDPYPLCLREDKNACLASVTASVARVHRGLCVLRAPHPVPPQSHRVHSLDSEENSRSFLRASSSPPSPLLPWGDEVKSSCLFQGLASGQKGEGTSLTRDTPATWSSGRLTLQCCIAVTGQQLSDQLTVILILVQPPGGHTRGC